MSSFHRLRVPVFVALVSLVSSCLDRPVASPDTRLQSGVSLAVQNNIINTVDILFEIDNSNSMQANQANLARNLGGLINQLVSPPDRNLDGVPDYPAATSPPRRRHLV